MAWVVGALVAVVGLVIGVFAAGSALPVAHTAIVRGAIPRPVEEVWAVIADAASYPSWRGDVTAVERLPDRDGHPVWREKQRDRPLTFEWVTVEEPTRLVARIADTGIPFGGTWTFELAADPAGCSVTVREDGEVYNPIFRLVAWAFLGYHGSLEAWVRALGKRFGAEVVPVRVA